MNWVLILALALVSCSKEEVKKPGDYMDRPETYRISPADADEISRSLGERVPLEFSSPMSLREIKRAERSVEIDLGSLATSAQRADMALEKMVNFASWLLKRKGFTADANQITAEYYNNFAGVMYQLETSRDIGDHTPLLMWLDTWYKKLESTLGPTVMRATKLEHLKILNYSIPVVFNPTGKNGEFWDINDYRAHFAGTRHTLFYPPYEHEGFAGVVTYWAVWGACTAATYGSGGALPFICAPVADVSSYGVGKWIAPKLSDKIYCKYSVCE